MPPECPTLCLSWPQAFWGGPQSSQSGYYHPNFYDTDYPTIRLLKAMQCKYHPACSMCSNEIKEVPNKMLNFKESVLYVSLPPTQPARHLLVTSATAWPSSRAPFQAAFWWIGTIVCGTSGQVWEYCSSILLCHPPALDGALNSCPTRLSSREKMCYALNRLWAMLHQMWL